MKKAIAILLLLALLLPMGATAEEETVYIRLYYRFANVVDLDYFTDTVYADDGLGNLWEFFGVDYFEYGDLIIMIMNDHGTPDWIYDDSVENAYTIIM